MTFPSDGTKLTLKAAGPWYSASRTAERKDIDFHFELQAGAPNPCATSSIFLLVAWIFDSKRSMIFISRNSSSAGSGLQ